MCIHNRQFVICKQRIELEDWNYLEIDSLVLSYSNNLNLKQIKDQNNNQWIILGTAIQTDANRLSPSLELENFNGKEIGQIYKTWTGRWILIGDGKIHLDAGGTMGCFYVDNISEVFVSSSSALLNELINSKYANNLYQDFEFERGKGMDYYPTPLTKYSNIKRLMPTQLLSFDNGINITSRKLLYLEDYSHLHYEKQLELLINYLSTGIINIQNEINKKLYVPLTAGMDSKLILAICLSNKININTVTFEQDNMLKADRIIPRKISERFNIPHKFIKKDKTLFSELAQKNFDLHCGGQCIDADRDLYSFNQFNIEHEGVLLLRGGIFEVARRSYYYKNLTEYESETPFDTILATYQISKQSEQAKAIREWTEWINKYPIPNLDWKHRFYLENRVGSWLSSIEQADDISKNERLHLINSASMISLMLSMPIDKRSTGQHQLDIIKIIEPQLAEYPINRKTFFEKVSNKIKRMI